MRLEKNFDSGLVGEIWQRLNDLSTLVFLAQTILTVVRHFRRWFLPRVQIETSERLVRIGPGRLTGGSVLFRVEYLSTCLSSPSVSAVRIAMRELDSGRYVRVLRR